MKKISEIIGNGWVDVGDGDLKEGKAVFVWYFLSEDDPFMHGCHGVLIRVKDRWVVKIMIKDNVPAYILPEAFLEEEEDG